MDTTLEAVIRRLVADDPDAPFDVTAKAVFDEIGCPPPWRDLFFPLVKQRVGERARRFVREREQPLKLTTVRPNENRLPVGVSAVTRPAFLRDTIETFGKWGRVRFGDMTVEMHESRIAGQLKLAVGVKRDIDKHADAIARIKAAKVACLHDLPEYGGKAKVA